MTTQVTAIGSPKTSVKSLLVAPRESARIQVIPSSPTTATPTLLQKMAAKNIAVNELKARINSKEQLLKNCENVAKTLTENSEEKHLQDRVIEATTKEITALRHELSVLEDTLVKNETTASDIENTAPVKRHWSCTVRFFQGFKDRPVLVQVIQALFSLVILAGTLLVDGCVLIAHNIIDGILQTTKDSGKLADTVVDTGVKFLNDEKFINATIETGTKIIHKLGKELNISLVALLKNKATFKALEEGLVGLIKSADLENSLADFIKSEKIKGAIKAFIEEQGETLVGTAKRVLNDEELELMLADFAGKFLGDTATGIGVRTLSNATSAVTGSVTGGASSLKGAVRGVYGGVKSFANSWLGRQATDASGEE